MLPTTKATSLLAYCPRQGASDSHCHGGGVQQFPGIRRGDGLAATSLEEGRREVVPALFQALFHIEAGLADRWSYELTIAGGQMQQETTWGKSDIAQA